MGSPALSRHLRLLPPGTRRFGGRVPFPLVSLKKVLLQSVSPTSAELREPGQNAKGQGRSPWETCPESFPTMSPAPGTHQHRVAGGSPAVPQVPRGEVRASFLEKGPLGQCEAGDSIPGGETCGAKGCRQAGEEPVGHALQAGRRGSWRLQWDCTARAAGASTRNEASQRRVRSTHASLPRRWALTAAEGGLLGGLS